MGRLAQLTSAERQYAISLGQRQSSNHIATWPVAAPSVQAHHLVMKSARGAGANAEALAAQQILQSYGIDPIFGYQNLVWAPNWHEHSRADTKYTGAVLQRLQAVQQDGGSKAKIEAVLKQTAQDFIGGMWK